MLRPLLLLAIISFLIMGSEGAIEQWSKLFLLDVVRVTSDSLAGIGFFSFSLAMAIGRFFGDALSARYGSMRIIIAGCALAFLGYLGVLYVSTLTSILGFAVIGLGFSVVIPETLRLAGNVKGVEASDGISFVAGLGFLGFLVSPAIVGVLADIRSLKWSFMFLAAACGFAVLLGIIRKIRKEIRAR